MFTTSIHSDKAPKAIGPYSPALKLGDFVYVSGQLPINPETNELVDTNIQEATEQVIKNIQAVLAEMKLELRHVVKTTVFLKDMNDFNGMNEVYGKYFVAPYPARSAVQVAALPKNAMVEIECLVIDTLIYEQQAACSSCGGSCSGDCTDCG